MTLAMRGTEVVAAVLTALGKRNYVFNIPSLTDADPASADVAFAVPSLEQGHALASGDGAPHLEPHLCALGCLGRLPLAELDAYVFHLHLEQRGLLPGLHHVVDVVEPFSG